MTIQHFFSNSFGFMCPSDPNLCRIVLLNETNKTPVFIKFDCFFLFYINVYYENSAVRAAQYVLTVKRQYVILNTRDIFA